MPKANRAARQAELQLSYIELRDFALLRSGHVDFAAGLTVISGPSGAGKSLIFDALAFVFGGRAHRSLLAAGAASCEVSLGFKLGQPLAQKLGEPWLSGENLLKRSFSASGRSRLELNGQSARVQDVNALAEAALEITGQFESRVLFNPQSHLELLDSFGDAALERLCGEYQRIYREYGDTRRRLAALLEASGVRSQEVEFLRFQVEELDKAAVREGERAETAAALKRQQNAQQLQAAAAAAARALSGDEDSSGAYDQVATAAKEIESLQRLLGDEAGSDFSAEAARERATALLEELRDLGETLAHFAREIQHEPAEELRLSERLDEILRLERKYAVMSDELQGLLEEKQQRLSLLTDESLSPELLEAEAARLLSRLSATGEELATARRAAAEELVRASETYLRRLDFAAVTVDVDFQRLGQPGSEGLDSVELLVSLNPGEPAKPLAQVASGGEASRLLLGFKAALAGRLGSSVILLDEIEAGVGADGARRVAEVLREMSAGRQLLAITHLPVVAAAGQQHLAVRKDSAAGSSQVRIAAVAGEERVRELMRMLGGQGSAEERALAESLLG